VDEPTVIEAIYEDGVLRPLKPLSLPEHARVRIQIIAQDTVFGQERERVREALLAAGVIRAHSPAETIEPASEDQLAAAAEALAVAGPLSEQIIAERNER
jgi:predicted DNA-binding antitoxin AbrB/MazE fold protein